MVSSEAAEWETQPLLIFGARKNGVYRASRFFFWLGIKASDRRMTEEPERMKGRAIAEIHSTRVPNPISSVYRCLIESVNGASLWAANNSAHVAGKY